MTIAQPLSLTGRFSQVIDALHALVAAQYRGPVLSVAMIVLICGHLRRIERRVLALMADIRAGTLRVGHGRGGRSGPRETATAAPTGPKLPQGYAWLVRAVPNKAAALGGWLRVLLEDPEMVALLAATPRLGRMLHPLCRMLAVETSLVTPAPAIAVVGEPRAARGGDCVTPSAPAPAGMGPMPYWNLRFFRPA